VAIHIRSPITHVDKEPGKWTLKALKT